MFGKTFYFGTTRKYIALFGTLFNDIMIERIDQTTGESVNWLKVPLAYGPRDRYLARLKANPDLQRQINQILPRMSFEIKSIEYDPSRKLNTIGRNVKVDSSNPDSLYSQYNPVPYNYNIELSILARNADDALRIVEQILPFFKPEFTATINLIPQMDIKTDVPIVLKSINYQDTYEASFNDRYAIIWTLSFTLKGSIYGPISSGGVIKEADVNFYVPDRRTIQQAISSNSATSSENFVITPGLTANGTPTSNASISIPSSEIKSTDNYGYIIDFYSDV